jgi:hypothetical protein
VAGDALPPGITTFQLSGFRYDLYKAIRTYFEFYKIDATDAYLQWGRFSSPIFLSLFCQATNPERTKRVGIESIPRSLSEVFEKYREVVTSRISERLRLAPRDVLGALARVGLALWRNDTRALDFDSLRHVVGDTPRAWDDSLARALEEEGVLSREINWSRSQFADPEGANQLSGILYDAFGGFVVADAILGEEDRARFPVWLSENWRRLDAYSNDRHPLSEDVAIAMVGLLPQRNYPQLWKAVPSPLRERALLETTNLDATQIDDETVAELLFLLRTGRTDNRRSVFEYLRPTRSSVGHPFNSDFLSKALSQLTVAQRDLHWTEWLRTNREEVMKDLDRLIEYWSRIDQRTESDRLRARWVMWTLTSSVQHLRDKATRALYRYGLGTPLSLFSMALDALSLNDPYIAERACAAAYGVIMGLQGDLEQARDASIPFLSQISVRLLGANATHPTNHWMTRQYIQGIFSFAAAFFPDAILSDIAVKGGKLMFGKDSYIRAADVGERYAGYLDYDFENHDVGRLFHDREQYGERHNGYEDALTEIRARIWALGWREDEFEKLDAAISERRHHFQRDSGSTDSYAQKYARIALQETAGIISDAQKQTRTRRSENQYPIVDIDPSFPNEPVQLSVSIPSWVDVPPADNKEWLCSGEVGIPEELLRAVKLKSSDGPWVAVDGYLKATNKVRGRSTFGFIRGLLIEKNDLEQVMSLLKTTEYLGNYFVPEEPSDCYTFAGEIPWSEEFASEEGHESELGLYKGRLGGHFGEGPVIELLSHRYAWEGYHSPENQAGGYSVPSKSFSRRFQLRSAASGFCQFGPDGKIATVSLSPPENFDSDGNILYIREDIVLEYASTEDRVFIWVVWGERGLTTLGYNHPEWTREIYQRHRDLWRYILQLSELTKE